jgi:predicted MPP superfamily phosphohydrolase
VIRVGLRPAVDLVHTIRMRSLRLRRRREPRGLRVTRHQVPWNIRRPIRVVQLTDLHVSPSTLGGPLVFALEWVRRSTPELVVLTGDYLNYSLKYVDALAEFVRALPKPCVAILGNHDHWSGAEAVQAALKQGGAEVLVNESTTVVHADFELTVIGLDDGHTGRDDAPRAFAGVRRPEDALVLTHHPGTADEIAELGGRLILAGHTHAGQVHVPGITRALGKAMGYRYIAGWYPVGAVGQGWLYVNAGIGSSIMPFRIGHPATPEVAVFDLVPRAEAL